MQCSVLLYSLLYKYCCTAVWRPPPPQCSYCSRHRLSGRRSYLHPQFTAQLVGACSYWHLGTEHVFLWPCAYYYYFLRLKFLTTKFLTGDAVCIHIVLDRWIQQFVCIVITYSKSMDQPGKVANPARGQLNRENECFPVRVRAWEFGLARRVGQSRLASACSSMCLHTGFLPISAAASIIIFKTARRHWVSPEFIRSRNCVPMAFTAESPPAQGQ